MICPKCKSNNVQIQVKNSKNPIMTGCVLFFGGISLMFLGVMGLVIGLAIGFAIGAVLKALMPTLHESIAVCQTCGTSFNPQEQPVVVEPIPKVEQTNVTGNTTLIINRCKNQCGSAISLNVRVDDFQTYTLTNGSAISINVSEGNHTIHYAQIGGVGKKKRTGFYNISVSDNKTNRVNLMFTSKGLSITEGSHA